MAHKVERLSDAKVRNTKDRGYHPDGAGLYLQVTESMAKSWIFRYTRGGRTREMGIGSYLTFTLKEARERAKAQRQLLADGKDPIDTRAAQRTQQSLRWANTLRFSECATRCISDQRAGWRSEKHAEQWKNTLETYAGPVVGKLPIDLLDTPMVLRILEPIWATKPETASRVRSRIENVWNWAKVHGYCEGENPARWRGHLENILPKRSKVRRVKHLAALPYSEIGAFVAELRKQPGIAPAALVFTILVAARTAEVTGANWKEFDMDRGVWTIPAERTKAGKKHRVPLSPRAIETIKAQPEISEHVFPGRSLKKPMSDGAMLMTLERMGRGDVTVHGFRSTFKDWASECTSFPNIVSEMALAHEISSDVEAAYRRGDLFEKRRRLMLDWARYCDTPRAGVKVVPLARKKA